MIPEALNAPLEIRDTIFMHGFAVKFETLLLQRVSAKDFSARGSSGEIKRSLRYLFVGKSPRRFIGLAL